MQHTSIKRAVFALFLVLLSSSLVGCANSATITKTTSPAKESANTSPPVVFAPLARVVLFEPGSGKWVLAEFKQTQPDSEFCYNNQFYRAIDSGKAQAVPNIRANRLFEAGRPYDTTSRPPGSSDIVQVLDSDMQPLRHATLSTVQSGTKVRFQGKAYIVTAKKSLKATGAIFYEADSTLQRIEVTRGALKHIYDRHTINGARNAGASIFNPDEDIRILIKNAEIASPMQSRDKFKRVLDAGHIIGVDTQSGKQTSLYTVITMQSGMLVTAYPCLR